LESSWRFPEAANTKKSKREATNILHNGETLEGTKSQISLPANHSKERVISPALMKMKVIEDNQVNVKPNGKPRKHSQPMNSLKALSV
jgi:hypothetical protein